MMVYMYLVVYSNIYLRTYAKKVLNIQCNLPKNPAEISLCTE